MTDLPAILTYNANSSYSNSTASVSPNFTYSNTSNTIATPTSGSPFLSKWNWDSGVGRLTAEIMTPHGVIVLVNSSAPTLAGKQVLQVYLVKCEISRLASMARTSYSFDMSIKMDDNCVHHTRGVVSVEDNAVMTSNGETYEYVAPAEKPRDRTKYIKWICSHMIDNESQTYCDECKTQHRR